MGLLGSQWWHSWKMPCIPQGGAIPLRPGHLSLGAVPVDWKELATGLLACFQRCVPVSTSCSSLPSLPFPPGPLSLVLRFTHLLLSQCMDLSDVCVEQRIYGWNTVVQLIVTSPGEVRKPSCSVLLLTELSAIRHSWPFRRHCRGTRIRDTFGQKNLEFI